jgi:dolichyl-phosphate beta-glucosyltransferase
MNDFFTTKIADGSVTDATTPLALSLILPAFNEERRIGKSLEQIFRFCNAQGLSFEVLVIDDGSTDETVSFVRQRFRDHPELQILQQPARRGKGAAVQRGMQQARGEHVFFSDADLSVPIETVLSFIVELQGNCDIAIGSRRAPGARIEVHQPFLRECLGRIFTSLSNVLLGARYFDVTCGFKGFKRDVAHDLARRQRLHNWSFDSELLFIARLKGYRVSEIPVSWRNEQGTKVRVWKDALVSFLGLLQIRLNQLLGKYR